MFGYKETKENENRRIIVIVDKSLIEVNCQLLEALNLHFLQMML